MDFQLNTDQKALQEGVRSFCEGKLPLRELPQFEKTGGFDRGLWDELADLGAFNLRLPEREWVQSRVGVDTRVTALPDGLLA